MIELVVFDLDGTLVDSSRDLADAANELIAELGGTSQSEAAITGMVGEGAALLVQRALTAAGLDPETPGALDRFLAVYDTRLLRNTVPYAGTREMLGQLADRRLAVLTNKPARATRTILDGLALEHFFNPIVGGDSPCGRKPSPGGLQHIIGAAGATPTTTLMVGDSPIDRATARAAGTHVCLVTFGFGFRFGAGDFDGTETFANAPEDVVSVARRL